jgi:SAM-dependent methyltransferase
MSLEQRVAALVVCPGCHGALRRGSDELQCAACRTSYPILGGVPVLFHPDSIFHGTATIPTGQGPPVPLYRRWSPQLTMWLDEEIFRLLNMCTDDMAILNVGSGAGRFDDRIRPGLRTINLDVAWSPRVHLLADGHFLPFENDSLDGIFSNAVLEHVQRPWIVAEEMWRVLKPGGRIFVQAPFLNIVHDTHDYFRFSDRALDVLFSRFTKVASGISGGPSSLLGPFLVEYLLCFVPGTYPKKAARRLFGLLAMPLKHADRLIRRSDRLRIVADAFYYVGVKR